MVGVHNLTGTTASDPYARQEAMTTGVLGGLTRGQCTTDVLHSDGGVTNTLCDYVKCRLFVSPCNQSTGEDRDGMGWILV